MRGGGAGRGDQVTGERALSVRVGAQCVTGEWALSARTRSQRAGQVTACRPGHGVQVTA